MADGKKQVNILLAETTQVAAGGGQYALYLPLGQERDAGYGSVSFLHYFSWRIGFFWEVIYDDRVARLYGSGRDYAFGYHTSERLGEPAMTSHLEFTRFKVLQIYCPRLELKYLQDLVQGIVQDLIQVKGLAYGLGNGVEGCQLFGPVGYPLLQVSIGLLVPHSLLYFLFLKRAARFTHVIISVEWNSRLVIARYSLARLEGRRKGRGSSVR